MAEQKQKSDFSRAFSEDGALKTHVGGQALIEGVMMRGKYNWAVGIRKPNGDLHVEEHDLNSGKNKNGWMYRPLVRGSRAMVESLVLGYKALEIAMMYAFDEAEDEAEATLAATDPTEAALAEGNSTEAEPTATDSTEGALAEGNSTEGEPTATDPTESEPVSSELAKDKTSTKEAAKPERAADAPTSEDSGFGKGEMAISMVLGVLLGVALFILLPALLTNLIVGEYDSNTLAWNIVDGLLRVAVFVFYIWLIGRMQDIKRMFMYHGAEHKTIHCYEHGLALTPENARSFPRLHVRCGTAFLIMVLIIAILVYTVVPISTLISAWGVPDGAPKLALVIVVRILLMPVIAGISYEVTVKWAGSHPDNPLVKVVLFPGMQMQYLTTREPDDSMLECAIAAMQLVLQREEAEAKTTTSASDESASADDESASISAG